MTCDLTCNATSLPESESGAMRFDSLGGLTIAEFGQALAPANLSARQAKAAGLLTSGICGPRGSTSSRSAALSAFMASRLQAATASLGSTLYSLIWKERVTPQGRSICALRASARRTSDSACGSPRNGWNTPQATDGSNGGPNQTGGALSAHLGGWRHPAARDWKDSGADLPPRADGTERFDQLPRQANLAGWTTPTAQDHSRGNGTIRPHDTGLMLAQHAALSGWPTPTASLATKGVRSTVGGIREAMRSRGPDLAAVTCLTVDGPARLTGTGELLTGSHAGTESGGQLNPAHSRWLMGLPAAWDCCGATATASLRKRPKRS